MSAQVIKLPLDAKARKRAYTREWKKQNKKHVDRYNADWHQKNKTRKNCYTVDHRTDRRKNAHTDRYEWAVFLIIDVKKRCRKKGTKCNLITRDIIIPEFCPALGVKLRRKGGLHAASIDRVNPKKGYVRGNVQVISVLANQIKSCATAEQVMSVARYMENF